jgi:hypothetical protein
MTGPHPDVEPSADPTIVLLTDHWESKTEPGWITRQVAGALACEADVHVVTGDGSPGGTAMDSVFTVPRPDPGSPDGGPGSTVSRLHPRGVVIAGRRWTDVADLVDRYEVDVDAPVAVLALAPEWDGTHSDTVTRLLDRARSVMVVTEGGRVAVSNIHLRPHQLHRIGAPMAANPSALSEPDPLVGDSAYVLVNSGVEESASDPANELGQLLRMRFPEQPVAILHSDAFCVWRSGRVKRTDPVQRSSDVARLMAWAQVTVDLRPGPLFAGRCVESLLYGTPIVVPTDSRAREHAERGRAGLWFANPAELTWCVEAMFDPLVRKALGAQGRDYAEAEFGSTDRFIRRVLEA